MQHDATSPGIEVDTASGRLAGRARRGALLFAGIPYAAPPTGDRRFAAPADPEPWAGVRDATAFGPVAPQVPGGMETLAGGGRAPDWSEDCLTLNVQTPACDGAKRPVMVWIHGGGFTSGSSSVPWYDGARFCEHGDVVVVTVNYRLGAFGWLHLAHLPDGDDAVGSGNAGLLDQIAALRWVRDNIAAFGGDPDHVTIFGESAGGMSVGTLMGTPAAKGLFHKAVLQSGAAHNVRSAASAAELADRVCRELGVTDVAGLRQVSAQALLDAQQRAAAAVTKERATRGDSDSGLAFGPVHDVVVLPSPPIEAIRNGVSAHVPVLVGTTRDEWNLFSLMARDRIDDDALLRRLSRMVEDPHQMVAAYRQAHDTSDHDAMWSAIMTDRVFRIPAIRLAEAQAKHQPDATFMYRFDWRSTAFDGKLGSCHALEIPFVFDGLRQPGVSVFTGEDAPQALADAVHAAWIAFARTGNPSHGGLPAWPAYDTEHRATMHFDVTCDLRHDPAPEQRAAWDGVM